MTASWHERCQRFEGGHIVTEADIQMMMKEEIGDLRTRIEQLEAAATGIDRYLLVIESAVRNADPSQHRAVLAALQANKAALAGKEET